MEVVALMNALTAEFTRTTHQSNRDTGRQAAQAAYLSEMTAKGKHPHIAAALAEGGEADPGQDPHILFERTMRRTLSGLVHPAHP